MRSQLFSALVAIMAPASQALAGECLAEPVAGDPDNAFVCHLEYPYTSMAPETDEDFDGLMAVDFTVSPAQCGRIGFSLFTGWSGPFGKTGPIPPGESRRVEFAEVLLFEDPAPAVMVWFYDPPCSDSQARAWDARIDMVVVED